MCHQANLDSGSLVIDPFVGTGSLLVPPAHYDAITFGSDIDMRVLQGTKVGKLNSKAVSEGLRESFTSAILLNFEQYGLRTPEIIRMDCLKARLRLPNLFDAIICDPPYGLRTLSRSASAKASKAENPKWQNFRKLDKVDRSQIFEGLFEFSDRYLRPGGRLVCLYPAFAAEMRNHQFDKALLPTHPRLRLLEASTNPISMGNARILMTL